MTLTFVISLLAIGCCTGFLAGLLGIGGGMIITPFLTVILAAAAIAPEHIVHVSIATSMGVIFFTSLSSVRAHAKRGAVRWDIVLGIAPGILIGAMAGARITTLLSTFWVSLVFAGFVGFSAFKMFFNVAPKAGRDLPGWFGKALAGCVIGIISGIVGAGGGFISVPFMLWCNVKMHNAVATSAALGFPIALAGTLGYILTGLSVPDLPQFPTMLGYIHIPSVLSVAAASVIFAPLGAKVAHSLDTRPLKRIFACLLLAIAAYMLNRAIGAY